MDEEISVGKLIYPGNVESWQYGYGTFETRIPVFLKKLDRGKASRDIERELYAFERSGNNHENIVRFVGSEQVDIGGKKFT